jgi:hypothetical protein
MAIRRRSLHVTELVAADGLGAGLNTGAGTAKWTEVGSTAPTDRQQALGIARPNGQRWD